MTNEMILGLCDNILYVLAFAWMTVYLLHSWAQTRSEERFGLTTFGIVLTIAIAALDLVRVVIHLMNDNYLDAGLNTLCAIVIFYFARNFFDDNNWFNDQFKKLKSNLKNLGKRLSNIRIPSLLPAPNPA